MNIMKKLLTLAISIFIVASGAFAAESVEEQHSAFFPKGTKSSGLNVSYNSYNIGNETGYNALFSLITGMKGGLERWKFGINGSYFLKDDFSLGLRFKYGRNSLSLDSGNLNFSDVGISLGNYYYVGQEYSLDIFTRAYIPIFGSKTVAFFGEMGLRGGIGQSKTYSLDDGLKHGAFQTKYSASIFAAPGVTFRVTNGVALEFSVEVFSIDWQNTVQIINQVDHSNYNSFGLNFNIDVLSANLALCMYF